jgi:peptide/nickel transport system permease protein
VHTGFGRYLIRRAAFALVLILAVSSGSLLLARMAPADDAFGTDAAVIAAERQRLGFDRPFLQQYGHWLVRSVQFDFGESLRFRRPVAQLIRERAANTAFLGVTALALATLIGIPAGVLSGSDRRTATARMVHIASTLVLSMPSLVLSLVLLLFAARTGWFPAGGLPHVPTDASVLQSITIVLRYLILPALAVALPIAASLERLQSRAIGDALGDPCIIAAAARGLSRRRIIWRHALPLSIRPVLAIYGIIIGTALSGSFVVEIVMSWQGLGDLMYQALQARDLFLIAGCAAVGAAGLAFGILVSDLALAAIDPRVEERA